MASIKYGNVVVGMAGSISGNVYAKNKGGFYSRVKVKPANPKTSAQSAVRATFTSLSQAWRSLTATQMLSWTTAVGNFTRKNRLGDSIILSGNALYVSLNKNLADVGIAPITTAPTPDTVESVAISAASASAGGDTVTLTLTGAVPANTSLKLFMSETTSAGVASIGTKLRQIASYPAAHAAILAPTGAYTAKFGAVGAVGSNIFYKIVPVNATTGQAGAAISGKIVIGA